MEAAQAYFRENPTAQEKIVGKGYSLGAVQGDVQNNYSCSDVCAGDKNTWIMRNDFQYEPTQSPGRSRGYIPAGPGELLNLNGSTSRDIRAESMAQDGSITNPDAALFLGLTEAPFEAPSGNGEAYGGDMVVDMP